MNKHEKNAWRMSIAYLIIMMSFLVLTIPHSSKTLFVELMFQIVIFVIFYLGFKKQMLIFSALGFGWLSFGGVKIFYRLTKLLHTDVGGAFLVGVSLPLVFMLVMTYFALRVFVAQMIERTRKS